MFARTQVFCITGVKCPSRGKTHGSSVGQGQRYSHRVQAWLVAVLSGQHLLFDFPCVCVWGVGACGVRGVTLKYLEAYHVACQKN